MHNFILPSPLPAARTAGAVGSTGTLETSSWPKDTSGILKDHISSANQLYPILIPFLPLPAPSPLTYLVRGKDALQGHGKDHDGAVLVTTITTD